MQKTQFAVYLNYTACDIAATVNMPSNTARFARILDRSARKGVHAERYVEIDGDRIVTTESWRTPKETSEVLRLPLNGVYRAIQRGEIRAVKLGRLYRVPQAELDRMQYGRDETAAAD